MRDKRHFILLALIAVAGLLLSLFLSSNLSIWLDERYSLVFATQLNIWELLYHSKDVHPGAFYVFLKGLLVITNDLFILRFILSILPQWVGSIAIVVWAYRRKFPTSSQVMLATLLFLNPFIIYSTIHLRMYGMVVLCSALIFVSFFRFLEKHTMSRFLVLVIAMLCANSVSYSFFFVSAGIALYLFTQSMKSPKEYLGKTLLFSLVTASWFWVLAGLSVKHIFEAGSWIPLPSFTNIQSLIQTIIGFETNYFLAPTQLNIFTLVFYSLGALMLGYLWKVRWVFQKYSRIQEVGLYLVILPSLFLLSVSILFPILSQRFFFYQFIPKLSVFLPRVFLPIVIFSSVLVAELLPKLFSQRSSLYQKNILSLIGSIVVIGWTMSYLGIYSSLRTMNIEEQQSQALVTDINSLVQQPIFVLPSWIWLREVHSSDLPHINAVVSKLNESKAQENLLTSGTAACAQLQMGTYVFVKDEIALTIDSYYEQAASVLDRCCTPLSSTSSVRYWSCKN